MSENFDMFLREVEKLVLNVIKQGWKDCQRLLK